MRRKLLFAVGVIAVSLAVLMIIGIAVLPQSVAQVLEEIPAKFLLAQAGLILIFILAIVLYWSLQVPTTAKVASGLLRTCLSIATGSIVAPVGVFGLQSLSVATHSKTAINITWATSSMSAAAVAIVAIFAACFALLEFRRARMFEYEHQISASI